MTMTRRFATRTISFNASSGFEAWCSMSFSITVSKLLFLNLSFSESAFLNTRPGNDRFFQFGFVSMSVAVIFLKYFLRRYASQPSPQPESSKVLPENQCFVFSMTRSLYWFTFSGTLIVIFFKFLYHFFKRRRVKYFFSGNFVCNRQIHL